MSDLVLYILFAAITLSQATAVKTAEPSHVEYVSHFLASHPTRLERALDMIPTVEKYSEQYDVDPLMVVIVMSFESSFSLKAIGFAKQEIGVMQVHGICAKGHDLTTVDGQIHAGISCLAKSRDACNGSMKQALTMYASGSCTARTKRTKWMIGRRLRTFERWKK